MLTYLDSIRQSTTHHVQISTVDPEVNAALDGLRPVSYTTMRQTHVTNANLQKKLLLEYERNSKKKSQEYTNFFADKKSLIAILFEQFDEATHTKITLGANCTEDWDTRRLIAFIKKMRTVYFGGDDGGLSYEPYK